tara:strand:+ start:2252 stop:2707 length:456 start_codon:yes stop_codon:yes gene_type:complete
LILKSTGLFRYQQDFSFENRHLAYQTNANGLARLIILKEIVMTKLNAPLKLAAITALGAGLFAATPAFAASNGDVEKCRAALTEQSEMDMSNYRLSYDREEGNRTKTIYFTAVSTDGGEDLNVTCTIKRSKVLAVNDGTKEISLLASNDKK